MRRLFFLALTLSLLLIACDSVSIGKPSTSAPRANSPEEHRRLCGERRDAIADWEREQERKITEKFADGKITFLRAGIDYEDLKNEVADMEYAVQENCNDAFMEKWGPN